LSGQASALFVALPFFAHFVVYGLLIAQIMAAVGASKTCQFLPDCVAQRRRRLPSSRLASSNGSYRVGTSFSSHRKMETPHEAWMSRRLYETCALVIYSRNVPCK
jgi:hypothetical protein